MPFELEQDTCGPRLKRTNVAVVGAGLAGLMAARELGRKGIKVTLFEAHPQVGGRVVSNTNFSNGRITEEGAELIASFHTGWLALAREYGLGVVSRMDGHLYERAGLTQKLTLNGPLSMAGIWSLENEMAKQVLWPISQLANTINDPSSPWKEKALQKYDDISVATALETLYKIDKNGAVWKEIESLLVNDEVAPLNEMNFLGLLCKVKGAQSVQFRSDGPQANLMRYWNELEVFRCADGCQTLARKIAEEIQKKYGATLRLNTAVTHIDLSKRGVKLGLKKVIWPNGTLTPSPPWVFNSEYVILAVPPSVWPDVNTSVEGKRVRPEVDISPLGMGPAVKFFSNVGKRFWIKEGAAPIGGSPALGQVWEGTDNQTQTGNQGIVLSVFAGPIISTGPGSSRAPTQQEIETGLRKLYRGYPLMVKTLFRDWPRVPFIKTGYATPKVGQIFTIGDKLTSPYNERLFFAGEHTEMDFFGYMEGALRSGDRAAKSLIQRVCPLRKTFVA